MLRCTRDGGDDRRALALPCAAGSVSSERYPKILREMNSCEPSHLRNSKGVRVEFSRVIREPAACSAHQCPASPSDRRTSRCLLTQPFRPPIKFFKFWKKHWEARSRLHQSRFWRLNIHFAAFFETYQIELSSYRVIELSDWSFRKYLENALGRKNQEPLQRLFKTSQSENST